MLTGVFGMKCANGGLESLDVYPVRIPAGSPETLINIFGFSLARVGVVKVNGTPVQFAHVGQVQISAMIVSDLLKEPGRLAMVLETAEGKRLFESVDIEVFSRKHLAELTVEASKTTLKFDETFSLSLMLTNRSSYGLYFARNIEAFVSGGVYSLEVRPLSAAVFHVPKRISISGESFLAKTAEEYAAAGLLIRLEPSQSYTATVNLKVTDLMQGLFPETAIPPGTYIVRAVYAGVTLPLKTAQTSVSDEPLYSNQIELMISK